MSSTDKTQPKKNFIELLGYDTIFACLPDPILVYDHSKRKMIQVNDAAVNRYGYSHREFMETVPWDLEAPYQREALIQLIDRLKDKKSAVYKTEHRDKQGRTFPVEVHTVYRNVEGADVFIATCREMTESVRSEARLQKAESHYRAIFETTTSLISIIDLNAALFLDVNPAFETLLGFTKKELLSTPFYEFIHPDDLERTNRIVKDELLAGKDAIGFQNRYRTKNGNYVWLEWSSRPFANKGLIAKGVLYAVAHHVSAQKEIEEKLREQNQRLRLHIDHTKLGVVEWDLDFKVRQWNAAAETIFGYTEEEAIGQHGSFILPEHEFKDTNANWHNLLADSGGFRSVNENIRKDGQLLVCDWNNTVLVDSNGEVVGVASLVFDVTEAEAQKKELKRAKEAAEKANKAKSEFLSAMSHELRTPLNSIVGPCQLLQAETHDENTARMLKIMLASSSHLLELINRILDLSKIESGALDVKLAPIHLEDFIKRQLLPLQTSAEKKGLSFSVDFSTEKHVTLMTDGHLLTQILINLVGNAIKFTAKGNISVLVSKQRDNIQIDIKDTGIGISEELMKHLFEPFRQGEVSLSQEQTGTGLGLSITKRIVEKLNGTISVESSLGKGSAFTFSLPYIEHATTEAPSTTELETTSQADSENLKVLVVEDEPNNQFVWSEMLNFLKYDFDLAKAGEEAIEMASKSEYNIIFMDIRMPGIDGIEAGKRIRALTGDRPLTIIAQSAYALKEQKEDFLRQGMDGYLSKPIELNALKTILENTKSKLSGPSSVTEK